MGTYDDLVTKLQSTGKPQSDQSAWAFDPTYENTKNTINAGLAGLQSSKDQQTGRLNQDFDTNAGLAARSKELQMNQLQERLANQGILRSGANVEQTGILGENYQNQINSMTTNRARGLEDIARDTATKQTDFQNRLNQNEIDRADRETSRELNTAQTQAQAEANKSYADQQRQWLDEMQSKIVQQSQPVVTPTGATQVPKINVQSLLQSTPAPPANTPQQQAAAAGVDPKQLQTLLTQRGFSTGPVDGIMGIRTQKALAAWKQSVGLPATADIDASVMQKLLSSGTGTPLSATGSVGAFIGSPRSGPAKRAL